MQAIQQQVDEEEEEEEEEDDDEELEEEIKVSRKKNKRKAKKQRVSTACEFKEAEWSTNYPSDLSYNFKYDLGSN